MALLPDRRLGELEALYRARHSHFVRVARAITGDPERASEAVQDAFADAVRARARFRGDGALEAWVWRAVVNAARKSLRRPLVEARRAVDEQTAIELDATPTTRALAPLVAQLPERQRLVVFLRYYADLDYRTIAEALGVELGTVSAALAAAHANVKRALQEVSADGRHAP
jgi:RNA polymerase sigma-70 factor (ECF subfamily)